MSDIPLNEAALKALLEAEAKYVPAYRMTFNPMPAMPRCTLHQYFSKYIPEFLKIQNNEGKEINRLPVVCQKFIRDIIYSICVRMSQKVSYGSLNPKLIWIEDGRAIIPQASQNKPHYNQGFPLLMDWMFSHLKNSTHVELDHFLERVKLLSDEHTFQDLYFHPILQTKQERHAYPTLAMQRMHSISDWRAKYKRAILKAGMSNHCFDRKIVEGNPIFKGVMDERSKTCGGAKYPTTVDGELELARNAYTHWQEHISTPLVTTEEAELVVAHYLPHLLIHIYEFFEGVGKGDSANMFGILMKSKDVGDIMACSN